MEWTEPPDCPGDEIARILAFEVFLDRFRTWMFPGLTVRREQVLGTWTLFIRLGMPASGLWHYEDLRRFVAATRFLFDASYDFSYVENDAVDYCWAVIDRYAHPRTTTGGAIVMSTSGRPACSSRRSGHGRRLRGSLGGMAFMSVMT